jgi:hypothetical protein
MCYFGLEIAVTTFGGWCITVDLASQALEVEAVIAHFRQLEVLNVKSV